MDFVQEQDLAFGQGGQDGGEVPACWMAGPLLIRSGAFISAATIMARVVLPEAGRAGKQHVVRAAAPHPGGLQHQRELFADAVLAHEVVEVLGPEGGFDGPLLGLLPPGHDRRFSHGCLPGCRRGRRPGRASAGWSAGSRPRCRGPQVGFVGQCLVDAGGGVLLRPAKAGHGSHHLRLPGRFGRRWRALACRPVPCGTSLPASSSTIRPATLGPMPGTLVNVLLSPVWAATRMASGSWTARTASASRGPTPLTLSRTSKTSRSSSEAKPNSVSESSRTIRDVKSLPFLAGPEAAEGLRRGVDAHSGAVEVDHGRGKANVRYGSAKETDQGRAPGVLPGSPLQGEGPAIRTYLRIP